MVFALFARTYVATKGRFPNRFQRDGEGGEEEEGGVGGGWEEDSGEPVLEGLSVASWVEDAAASEGSEESGVDGGMNFMHSSPEAPARPKPR
jgi:hypothetical protein